MKYGSTLAGIWDRSLYLEFYLYNFMNIHEASSVGYSEELVDHMYRIPAKFDYLRAGRNNIHCSEVHVACARESS